MQRLNGCSWMALIALLMVPFLGFSVGCATKDDPAAPGAVDDDDDGDDTDPISATVAEWVSTFPSGLAIASPTAARLLGGNLSFLTEEDEPPMPPEEFSSEGTFEEKAEAFDAVVNADSADECVIALPTIQAGGTPRAECYGPTVDYVDHPDGAGGDGQLPSGDLGLWEETDQGGQACVAAEMNQLINSAASYVDNALGLTASMACLLRNNGEELPAVGDDPVDITDDVNEAITSVNDNVEVTNATVEAVAVDTYQYTIVMEQSTGMQMTIYLKHTPFDDDNTTYLGKIWGMVEFVGVTSAFSVSYQRGDDLKMWMVTANRNAEDVAEEDIFDAFGNVEFADDVNGMTNTIYNLDPETGLGDVSYAWIAGSINEDTRIFNVHTAEDAEGIQSGCGFFGFGVPFESDPADNTNTITKFICNWAGPGNSHNGVANFAQKQCMEKDETGIFVATINNITYAPTNSCDDPDTGAGFTYDWPAHSADGAINDLVDLTSDPEFAEYTAPEMPTLEIEMPDLGEGF